MRFSVVDSVGTSAVVGTAYLVKDRWDDWGEYETQFHLEIATTPSSVIPIGDVKIGRAGLTAEERRPALLPSFAKLPSNYFSLGQSEDYYENLNSLGADVRDAVLAGLRDLAADLQLFAAVRAERVVQRSLLRYVRPELVNTQLHRMAKGGPRLSAFRLSYPFVGDLKASGDSATSGSQSGRSKRLSFSVKPTSEPPSNLHVIIGSNGVGKTTLLRRLAELLIDPVPRDNADAIDIAGGTDSPESLSSLVSVSFSAFDPFVALPKGEDTALRYTYVGLHATNGTPKPRETLEEDFVASAEECRPEPRRRRLLAAIERLRADPLFENPELPEMLAIDDDQERQRRLRAFFGPLSSGHKIATLTLTRLVELVDERTLVLFDEPEAHLHPPLLSALIRALIDLLLAKNGIAIVATHSPVVLQEVPRSCVWKLYRSGTTSTAQRPEIETFGENVGVLTRDVFGLQVTQAGFHQLLAHAVDLGGAYQDIVERFREQLGFEARSLVRSMVNRRDAERAAPE